VLYSWPPLYPVGALWTAPLVLLFSLGIFWQILLLTNHFIPPFLSGGVNRNQSIKFTALNLFWWDQAVCLCSHVFLTSLTLTMITNQSHRIRIPMSLWRILSEQAKAPLANAVYWACPSFVLFLLLVNVAITGPLPSSNLLKQDMQIQVNHCALGLQDPEIDFSISMSGVYFVMFWGFMINLCYWLYVIVPAVIGALDLLSYLVQICALWFGRVVVKHGCMLGLCHKALDQH